MATWQLFGRAILSLLCTIVTFNSISAQTVGGGPNQLPTMFNIFVSSIDYQGNVPATDRHYHSHNQIHPAVEYINDPDLELSLSVPNIVYTKGTQIHGQTTVKNTTGKIVDYSLIIQPGTCTSEAPNEDQLMGFPYEVRQVTYTVSTPLTGTIPSGGTVTFSWTSNGVPEFLCAGSLYLPAKLRLTFPTEPGSAEYENDISMAGIELSRMVSVPVDVQQIPWADFAYEVGLWGWGAETQNEAKQNLTYGIHYSNRHAFNRLFYESSTPNFYYAPYEAFLMTPFLVSIGNSLWTEMDCQDFSSILSYAFECNGVDTNLRWVKAQTWFDPMFLSWTSAFYTRELCPAGFDSSIYPGGYRGYRFDFHQIAEVGGLVYDTPASHLVNPQGSSHMNPVPGWQMPNYWQTYPGGLAWHPPYPHGYEPAFFALQYQLTTLW